MKLMFFYCAAAHQIIGIYVDCLTVGFVLRAHVYNSFRANERQTTPYATHDKSQHTWLSDHPNGAF